MKKNDHRTKEIILSICGVLFLIVAVISTSMAVFVFSAQGTTENTITTGGITFTYNDEKPEINIVNAQPMTDAAGKSIVAVDTDQGIIQGYFDFSVSGEIIGTLPLTYEVYGTLEENSTLDPDYVKVFLTDGSSEVPLAGYDGASMPLYGSLPQSTSDPLGKRLYVDSFSTGRMSQSFRLRIWVADTYKTADVSKTFSMRVHVKASA